MSADDIARAIYNTLSRQKFADWYQSGDFDAHISGADSCKSREAILEDIKKLFPIE